MRRISIAVLCLVLAPAASFAQPGGSTGFKHYEISFGLGGGSSSEKDIFNVPSDQKSTPDLLISFAGRMNFDEHRAIGVHFYGGTEKTGEYTVVNPATGVTGKTTFNLDTFNFGVDGRYTFSRGQFQPFAFIGASAAGGTVESAITGSLDCSGFSIGGGPGINWSVTPAFAVGLEGLFSFGSATWEKKPFTNSTSDEFDPSLLGAHINLTVGWGNR